MRRAGDQFVVVGAREALGVPDHVALGDVEARHEPARELERGRDLTRVREDPGRRAPDVLDADRRVVEADRVATADCQWHELVDRPVRVDHEVRAHVRQLVQLRVGVIGREGVVRARECVACGVVLDDHLGRDQAPLRGAVVALGVGRHLGPALSSVRNGPLHDRRLGRCGDERRNRQRDRDHQPSPARRGGGESGLCGRPATGAGAL